MAINKARRSPSIPKPKPAAPRKVAKEADKGASANKAVNAKKAANEANKAANASKAANANKAADANKVSNEVAGQQAAMMANPVRPRVRDGFESASESTSTQRNQQARRLGSTTAAVEPASTGGAANPVTSTGKPASANTVSALRANTAAGQASTTGNPVRPGGSDGFELASESTSTQRSQQAQFLGSTTAEVAPTGTGGGASPEALSRIGLTEDDLRTAGAAARPNLERGATAALQGQNDQALTELRTAGVSAPDIAQKAIKGLAQNLPEGPAKTLLTDDAVTRELITNNELHTSVNKLMSNPGDTGAIRELVGNDRARDAALGALSNDPTVNAQLERVGLESSDLVEAGRAAPKLWDSFDKLQQGDVKGGLTDFQAAVEAAPGLADKMGQKMVDAIPQSAKEQFAKLGVTEEHLRTAGPALPHLYDAADAASKQDYGKSFDSLKEAAIAAPDVTTQAMKGLASQLPDELGAAKSLLTDDGFLRQVVTNRELHGQVGKLFDADTRMEGLRELVGNDSARDAALTAIGNDPGARAQLERVGLEPSDLVEAGRAAPQLWDAFDKLQQGDVKGGLTDFQAAVEAAPGLAGKMGQKVVDAIPQPVKEQFAKLGVTEEHLRTAGPALPHLYDAADAASKQDYGAAFDSLKEAAIAAPDVTTQAMKGLASQLPDELGAAKSLLTDDAFLRQVVTNRELHDQVGQLFNADTRMEGLRGLLGNDSARDAALTAIGNDPGVQAQLEQVGLEPKDLMEAGAAAPHVFDAVQALNENRLDDAITALGEVGQAAPGLLDEIGGRIASKLPENLRTSISNLGITPSELLEAGRALPDLLQAGKALGEGDFQDALKSLKDAAGKMPSSIIEKAITTTAGRLPSEGFSGVARSLLTDPAFVKELVGNEDLHASFDKMMSGDLVQGTRELLDNERLSRAAGEALANNREVMDKLTPFGIRDGQDIAALGGSVFDVMDAGAKLAQGRPGEALRTLGKALEQVPPDLRGRMAGAVADQLGAPDWAKDTLVAAASLLGNDEVSRPLGDALGALKRGDVQGFVEGIATTGRSIAQTAPETAKAFLNSLSRIPGSLGELFEDRELNTAMVDSGSVTNLFEAAEKLAAGDVGGAMNEIAEAGSTLLTQGEHFEVRGRELPFGQQGIENYTRIFERFVDALPDELKEKIAHEAAQLAGKVGLKAIPVLGNVASGVSAIGSANDLYDALKEEPRDPVDVALAAGQLALDSAGVFPGLNSLTGPLQMVLGTAKVIKGASDLIGNVRQYQQELIGG